ncbi:MAG: CHAT domain-containing protein [Maritimibacter sp.]|uniref:CHAT domain-containing tetratricopeptide repeat protein n=1 Tax=Maritimibacter sp. TaxID=2003363 RepID=UPI001D9B7E89|nr:CHAT domain-containing protein [Maritimibacter sp.]MBL6426707.1 CHAT domain-containing protein [Maritimibacter sp.]
MSKARSALAVALALLLALPAAAQDLDALNAQAIAAYGAGDAETALSVTEDAVAAPPDVAEANPTAYLLALNNLTFLVMGQGDAPRADDLSARAVAFGEAHEIDDPGVLGTAFLQRAQVLGRSDGAGPATEMLRRMMQVTRDTPAHGFAASAAGDLAFDLGRYVEMLGYYREMVAVTGVWTSAHGIDVFYDRQLALEAEGDIAAVAALIDTRILLVETAQPQLAEEFAHSALWTKFYMHYEAENFGEAADALTFWAGVGTMTEDERESLTEIAANILERTRRGEHAERSAVQLGYAELAVALARIVHPANDPRIGVALRERADAESRLGLYARAAATLQEALAYPEGGRAAMGERTLLLEDLANNAWQIGAYDQSRALYEQAEVSYNADLAAGMAPFAPFDRSVLATNRAKLALETGDIEAAAALRGEADALLGEARAAGLGDAQDLRQQVEIAEIDAYLAAATGRDGVAATLRWVELVRRGYPDVHADRAQKLHNAADQLMVLGRSDIALDLLAEAQVIAAQALPPTAPLAAEIAFRQAVDAVMRGDRDAARTFAARTVAAYRAPENRDELGANRWTFDIYAWLLLDRDAPPPEDIDAALAAVQWTQVNRAAEAVDQMNARMMIDDPAQAVTIRARQDVVEALTRSRSALTTAYARGEDPATHLERQAALSDALSRTEAALADAGLALTGQAPITPLTVADIQALLTPGEVLVTFLLPGLKPDAVPGLGPSSNKVIAIARDEVRIAPVAEAGRGSLVARIAAFRCEMAVSDGACGVTTGSATMRGAMLSLDENAEPATPAFDWNVAYGLYADLFGGVQDVLNAADHLIIAPPGDLLNLPFSALVRAPGPHDLASAPWLVREHAISVLPSIPALSTLRAPHEDQTEGFLGIGDPIVGADTSIDCAEVGLGLLRGGQSSNRAVLGFDAGGLRLADPQALRAYARLPDTRCELEAMQDAFGKGDLILGPAATETKLKRLDREGALARYGVVAFATHGLISGEAGTIAPGLLLTPPDAPGVTDDGLLTSAEIATLDLNARLVILSACNTAAGENPGQEGLSGLAGSFFHAGARALMVTHWSVFSDASARVGSGIATRIAAKPDLSNAEALRETVLDMLDGAQTDFERHPAYWAPFAIIGG